MREVCGDWIVFLVGDDQPCLLFGNLGCGGWGQGRHVELYQLFQLVVLAWFQLQNFLEDTEERFERHDVSVGHAEVVRWSAEPDSGLTLVDETSEHLKNKKQNIHHYEH